jgi:AcrR family transcriptional regulator
MLVVCWSSDVRFSLRWCASIHVPAMTFHFQINCPSPTNKQPTWILKQRSQAWLMPLGKNPQDNLQSLFFQARPSNMARLKAPQRREQLMEVATKLFAQLGYEATTTAAIAEAAGVTEPILYRHFKSKQELFIAIVRAVSDQTLRQWHELIAGTADPAERIRRIAVGFPQHIRSQSDAYHVLHGALATSRDRKVLAVMREHYAQIEEFFADIVSAGQKAGVFVADMDPRVPAWQLINIGIGYAMISSNLSQFEGPMIEQAIDFILRGVR